MILLPIKSKKVIRSIISWEPNMTHDWILILDNNEIIGIYELQCMTKVLANCHMHIKEEYRRQGYGIKSYKYLMDFLAKFSIYNKIMCTIAESNLAMIQGLKQTKYKLCGYITNGIIIDSKPTNLLIYEHDILR